VYPISVWLPARFPHKKVPESRALYMHVIFFWRETRRLCNAVGVAGSSPTGEPYEKQQQNQGRLLQEQKLELQHLRYQLQGVRTSSLVLVQELEQELEQALALALVLELELDQGLELELELDQELGCEQTQR